jgi:hypothetical protein
MYDETLRQSNDRDLLLRLSRLGPMGYFEVVVARYRLHSTNLTRNGINKHACFLRVWEKMLAMAGELKLDDEELALTRKARDRAVQRLLFRASHRGLGCYVQQSWNCVRKGYMQPLYSPTKLLRSLFEPRGTIAVRTVLT